MSKKIKILHIIKSLGRGGAETLLPETLKLHDKEKFEWHYIYFLPWKDQMVPVIQKNGGKVTCLRANNNIQILLRGPQVVKYIQAHNIHIIHSHLPWAGILSRLVGKMIVNKIPIIYTEHNKQERYHFATRWMNLATMNWLTQVVAVSEDVEHSVRRHKPTLKVPLKTLLNGVNDQDFAPGVFDRNEIKLALGIPLDSLVVGTIAVFRSQKRLELWMETASKIAAERPQVHFIIVGDGPLKEDLLRKRTNLKMDHNIHFTGLQTEVRPYLAAFDVYMMSSLFEGLPIALLEAMAFGCPVVSTDAGGVKEVIRHGYEGLLCDTNQPELLSGLALSLLNSAETRKHLAKQARKRIESSFSMKEMVQALEALYKQLIETIP
jgi:glycosyltransferase involved in cell wall biosynthesis